MINGDGPKFATTSNGVLLKVKIEPRMLHLAGRGILQSAHVYMPRKLNATSTNVRMGKYLLIDHMVDWLTAIPPEHVDRIRSEIDTDRMPTPANEDTTPETTNAASGPTW